MRELKRLNRPSGYKKARMMGAEAIKNCSSRVEIR